MLLISSDFLSSDYCYDVELKRAMEKHERREAQVIPVILRPVDWSGAPFGKLQALPTDAKPVTSWENRDEAFVNIAKGIRVAAKELTSSSPASPTVTVARHDPVKMVETNETAILRALFDEHRSNPTGLGLHEDDLQKTVGLVLEELTLIVKGLEVKGLLQTDGGTDDDVFGFAKLTALGIQSMNLQPPAAPAVAAIDGDDDEELGLLDYQIAVEEALAELTDHMGRIGRASETATPKVTKHGEVIQNLKQSGGTAGQIRSAVNALAADIVDYAKELEAIAPPMRDAWERMVQNTSAMITSAQVQNEEDRTAGEQFIATINGTQTTFDTLLKTISTTRAQIGVMRGVSQDLNRAVRRTDRALDTLASEIRTGKQYIESIRALVKEKFSC